MTILTWPDLPNPERDTWTRQRQDARLKRISDAGPPAWRRRFSNAAQMVSLSVVLDRDQNAIFDNFYRFDTREGSSLFWMPDPTTDGVALLTSNGAPVLIAGGAQDGQPLVLGALWLCSFGEQVPTEAIVGAFHFRRTFAVVVMP
jgi:hypothetical protein